jgi:ribosome-binding protein aMBF1 (putative translation factor)
MRKSATRKTRRQVQRWAQQHIPDQVEKYGEDLLDWIQPARQHRGWAVAYILLMIAAVAGAVVTTANVIQQDHPDA